MFFLLLWIYTISIIAIWWFFIVARIHAYKFKNFSPHIKKVTFTLTISLIVLTILGYTIVFSLKDNINGLNFWEKNDSTPVLDNIKKTNSKLNNTEEWVINYDDL